VIRPSAAYAAIGGLTIHTFFDGVSIASAFLMNVRVGVLVFIAIMLHKVTFLGVVGVALMKIEFANSGRLRTSLFRRRHFVRGGERSDSGS
jgi:zinc transporter ZupT